MTVYQNISFGLTNIKEELPKIDFDTRHAVWRMRSSKSPRMCSKVLAECRDKKGKLDDGKRHLRLIEPLAISQFTAKKLLGYHLEDGKDVSAEAAALRRKAARSSTRKARRPKAAATMPIMPSIRTASLLRRGAQAHQRGN